MSAITSNTADIHAAGEKEKEIGIDFHYMVMGGADTYGECAVSTRFYSTMEEAEAYSASIVENNEYDYAKILETRNIKDCEGGFCYMVIGAMEEEAEYIETARLFADRASGNEYGDSLTEYDFVWIYRITIDGKIDTASE